MCTANAKTTGSTQPAANTQFTDSTGDTGIYIAPTLEALEALPVASDDVMDAGTEYLQQTLLRQGLNVSVKSWRGRCPSQSDNGVCSISYIALVKDVTEGQLEVLTLPATLPGTAGGVRLIDFGLKTDGSSYKNKNINADFGKSVVKKAKAEAMNQGKANYIAFNLDSYGGFSPTLDALNDVYAKSGTGLARTGGPKKFTIALGVHNNTGSTETVGSAGDPSVSWSNLEELKASPDTNDDEISPAIEYLAETLKSQGLNVSVKGTGCIPSIDNDGCETLKAVLVRGATEAQMDALTFPTAHPGAPGGYKFFDFAAIISGDGTGYVNRAPVRDFGKNVAKKNKAIGVFEGKSSYTVFKSGEYGSVSYAIDALNGVHAAAGTGFGTSQLVKLYDFSVGLHGDN